MLNVAPFIVLTVSLHEIFQSQTVLPGPSEVMDRKKQCGSSFGSQPGGSSMQDFVCPHPSDVN